MIYNLAAMAALGMGIYTYTYVIISYNAGIWPQRPSNLISGELTLIYLPLPFLLFLTLLFQILPPSFIPPFLSFSVCGLETL